jgi:hypothetical protein
MLAPRKLILVEVILGQISFHLRGQTSQSDQHRAVAFNWRRFSIFPDESKFSNLKFRAGPIAAFDP